MRCFCRSCFLVREKIFNIATLCSLGEKNKQTGHDGVIFEIFGDLRKMRWHVRSRNLVAANQGDCGDVRRRVDSALSCLVAK